MVVALGDIWQSLEIFGVLILRGGRSPIWYVEPMKAAEHPVMHRVAPNNKALSCTECQQYWEEAKGRLPVRHQKWSLRRTSCQILVPSYDSSQILCLLSRHPRTGPAPNCVVKMPFLLGALKGKFMLPPGPFTLGCWTHSKHLRVLWRHQLWKMVTQSTDYLRLLHIKSLISISFLSLLENMCPEEAEIFYRLESNWRTVNPHTALVN